ncbi:MAG: GAF domain-containing protein [Acetilactobacillus jinshanensis]
MDSILVSQAEALTTDVNNVVTNLANVAALLMQTNPQVSWAGFYMYRPKANHLWLGPYQGKLACNIIPNGKGVCGTADQTNRTQLVKDVSKFPGHIACDSASQSEIVVPLLKDSKVIGVMDLDSNQLNAFSKKIKRF